MRLSNQASNGSNTWDARADSVAVTQLVGVPVTKLKLNDIDVDSAIVTAGADGTCTLRNNDVVSPLGLAGTS